MITSPTPESSSTEDFVPTKPGGLATQHNTTQHNTTQPNIHIHTIPQVG